MEDFNIYRKSDTSTLRAKAAGILLKYINFFEIIDIDVSYFGNMINDLLASATFTEDNINKTFMYDPKSNTFISKMNCDNINTDDFRYAVISLFLNASKKTKEEDFEELFIDEEAPVNNDYIGLEFSINNKKYSELNKKVCEKISEYSLGNPEDKIATVLTYEDDIFRNFEYLIGSDKLIKYFINNEGQALYNDLLGLFNGNKDNCKRFLDVLESFGTIDRNNAFEYNRACKNYHDIEQGLERIVAIKRNSQNEVKKAI